MVRQHHQLNGHKPEQTPGDSETEKPGVLQSMESQRVRYDFVAEQQQQNVYSFDYPCSSLDTENIKLFLEIQVFLSLQSKNSLLP